MNKTLTKIYESFLKGAPVCTDTRKIDSGCIFFALKGANFNGNRFAMDALSLGAAMVVVDEAEWVDQHNEHIVLVDDVLRSLQSLATQYRRTLPIPVLAIGGSNGKTTTKELIRLVLTQKYKTVATSGNLNNHIGVPLTLLSIPPDAEIAVIEMGTNHPGEMAQLCEIAEPDYGLVTNIGKEHLEGFGDIEGVVKEESYLFQYLSNNGGFSFVNADDKWLNKIGERLDRKISYGFENDEAEFRTEMLDSFPGVVAKIKDSDIIITSRLPGSFNMQNITAAMAVGHYFDVPIDDVVSAIESYQPTNKRSQVILAGKYSILLDCYNANPTSMELAIESVSKAEGMKALILGDMLELGEHSASEHEHIANVVKGLGYEEVYTVGPEFSRFRGLMDAKSFNDSEQLNEYFRTNPPRAGFILVKGSRGLALEKALQTLGIL